MKKLFLTLLVIVVGIKISEAQCTVNIFPIPGHVQITTSQTIAATGTVYWVCEGVTLTVSSSPGSAFLLEKNATIIFNGGSGDQVSAKDNCVITNNSNDDVGVICNLATITMNNLGSGTLVVDFSCNPVIFDYSLLPGGAGTCGATGIYEESNNADLSFYPNPVKSGNEVFFALPNNAEIKGLYDITGRNVGIKKNSNSSFSTVGLKAGFYFVKIKQGEFFKESSFIISE